MKQDHFEVLLEQIQEQNQAILEYVKSVPKIEDDIADIKQRLGRVETNTKVVQSVVQDHSVQLHDHRKRIARLKAT